MLAALLWGLVGSSSLVIGAFLGVRLDLSKRLRGLLMGFGAGTLVSAISFELADEALSEGGPTALAIGLTVGALAFYFGDLQIERMGARRPRGAMSDGSGLALALGALLDGVPEQAAIGLSLAAESGTVGLALVVAVFISNIPEALGSAAAMKETRSARSILTLWAGVAIVTALASVVGYAVLGDASGTVTGAIQAVAAGAILVMLVDAMFPEALREGGRAVGLVCVLGFAVAALLSHASA